MSMTARERQAIQVAKALADPTRWRLLQAISTREEISCADLVALAGLSQATVSHHLKILAAAGLISVRKSGPFHYHRAVSGAVQAHGAALAAAFTAPGRRRKSPRRPTSEQGVVP